MEKKKPIEKKKKTIFNYILEGGAVTPVVITRLELSSEEAASLCCYCVISVFQNSLPDANNSLGTISSGPQLSYPHFRKCRKSLIRRIERWNFCVTLQSNNNLQTEANSWFYGRSPLNRNRKKSFLFNLTSTADLFPLFCPEPTTFGGIWTDSCQRPQKWSQTLFEETLSHF